MATLRGLRRFLVMDCLCGQAAGVFYFFFEAEKQENNKKLTVPSFEAMVRLAALSILCLNQAIVARISLPLVVPGA